MPGAGDLLQCEEGGHSGKGVVVVGEEGEYHQNGEEGPKPEEEHNGDGSAESPGDGQQYVEEKKVYL